MNKSRRKLLISLGILILIGICFLIAALTYFSTRAQTVLSRPLVLIHNPINRDHVETGSGIIVHATARSQAGIARMELWADDVLVAEQEAPEGTKSALLVLSTGWVPIDPGDHRLVVRAVSDDDVEGQSTITLKALDAEEDASSATHIVQEGETLETIASGLGTTPEELTDLNPGLDPGGPAAGEELIVPDDEPVHEGGAEEIPASEPLPESSGEAPSPEGDPPGDRGFFLGPVFSNEDESGEPTGLRLELVSLRTGESYESLHCYVGLAGATPQWYPDSDYDQTTDESFSTLSGIVGEDASWNVTDYFSGDTAPVLFWPANLSMPLDASCVGVAGGGTQALELGSLALSIPPADWDGIVRRVDASGAEGSFTLGYRVSPIETQAGVAKEIDPNMTAPTNLRGGNYYALLGPVDDGEGGDGVTVNPFFVSENDPFALLWDYNPEPDEVPIDGFRIYLNGNLQWTEVTDRLIGSSHYTVFPPEWRHPPCGEEYTLTVSAWRRGGTDGYESNPADPAIVYETSADDCQNYLSITLLTLETFDIGGDGSRDSYTGDVGPPYGHFYANEDIVSFDTGSPNEHHFIPNGFLNNFVYYSEALASPNWGFSGPLRWVTALDEYSLATVGFEIWDEDTGRCRDNDDPGCPDLICEGQEIFSDNGGRPYEAEIWSTNRQCKATYSVALAPGSYSMEQLYGDGNTPEPILMIENLIADDRNRSTFQIVNRGNAAWTYRPLQIEVRDRTDSVFDTLFYEDFYLAPGASYDVEYLSGGMPAVNVCFLLDIESQIGIFGTVCPGYPEANISDLVVNYDTGGLSIELSNTGTGDLYQQDVELRVQTREGELLGAFIREDTTIRMGEALTFEDPTIVLSEPYDACVAVYAYPDILIPDNISGRDYACTPQADLVITHVEYRSMDDGSGTMNVTVRNNWEGILNRTLHIQTTLPDGSRANIQTSLHNIDLAQYEEIVVELPVPSEASRAQLLNGYAVAVNPEHEILEINYANNNYQVPGRTNLQLFWCGRFIPHLGGYFGTSAATMNFSAYVMSGSATRSVMERSWSHELTGVETSDVDRNHWEYSPDQLASCDRGGSSPFEIMGDEWLEVIFSGTYRSGSSGSFGSIGTIYDHFDPNDHWEAGRWQEGDSWLVCGDSGGRHYIQGTFSGGTLALNHWHSYFLICEITP